MKLTRARRWVIGSVITLLLLLGGGAWIAWRLLPSDEQLAARVSESFERASGIGLRVGGASWSLRPAPVVVLRDLATDQSRPITVRRVVLRPRLAALLRHTIAIEAVDVEGAVLPRASVRAFRGRWKTDELSGAMPWIPADTPIERLRLNDVVWINRQDIALAYDADVRFDPGWRPREAELQRPGVSPTTRLHLAREGNEDRWRVEIDAGGGTWNGEAELHTSEQGHLRLTAQLEPRGVDVGELVGAFRRHQAVQGRFNGRTEVRSEGDDVGELMRHLNTRTRFVMRPATIKGFDLSKVVGAPNAARGGQTVLDELTGTVETQTTEDGILLRYIGLKARSGVLSASGSASVLNRRLDGEMAIDLVDGMVGVPLKLAGTLDNPQVSMTGGALAGAAVGTAVLPGVGTAIGARVGQQVEKLFGGDDENKPPRRPAPSKAR
ncbi:AsmA-like C-terminal region-containing protein [Variovorax sp. PBS-H4]|uniref:AsmA-like C-terminal region-containing protein n=1 Tax=Variovorax sp. PBS-H4 TaxID=434008 RepID=UPI0013A5BC1B|nr:AsmA-like C-terminal region-containing protein [Variovorax sp. PBS-H4]